MEHDAEEDGEQCGSQNASLLDAVGDWEAAWLRPIVLQHEYSLLGMKTKDFWPNIVWMESLETAVCVPTDTLDGSQSAVT